MKKILKSNARPFNWNGKNSIAYYYNIIILNGAAYKKSE